MNDRAAGTVGRIPGRLQPDEPLWLATQVPPGSTLFLDSTPARAFRLGGIGARGNTAEAKTKVISPDALVEIEFESGRRFWTSGDRLRERMQEAGGGELRRGAAPSGAGEKWEFPLSITPPGADARGVVGKLAIRALRWVGLDPVKASVDKAVEMVATRSVPREGLFRVREDGIGDDGI